MGLAGSDALIAVDVQNDFCPGGSLAVPRGEVVAARLTEVAQEFVERGARVIATQDWHPPDHSSFSTQGGPWPDHCVQRTYGAEFHSKFVPPPGTAVVRKGTDPRVDAYSGFLDSDLETRLREAGTKRVFVGGLATDYCVLNTALDALGLGFETYVLTDAIGAVDMQPGDGVRALETMSARGASLVTSDEVLSTIP